MIDRKIRNILALVLGLALAAAFLAGNPPRAEAAGTHLDATFDGDGKARTDFPGATDDKAEDVAVQADGKIVVAGYRVDSSFFSTFAVARYHSNGTLDTSFSGDGRATTIAAIGGSRAFAVVIQPDGKIVVAGYGKLSGDSPAQFALVRYNTDGSLDTSFDGDGIALTQFDTFPVIDAALVRALALQPDGKIVAAGLVSGTPAASDWAVARYNINGTPDTAFSGDGRTTIDFNNGSSDGEDAEGVIVLPDGKILVGGTSILGGHNFALARLNTNGALDVTFNSNGKVITDFGGNETLKDIKLQADGRIVAAGATTATPFGSAFALARYNADGTLDAAFDGDGKVITDGQGLSQIREIALQPDGKIVAVGGDFSASAIDFTLARYHPNGGLDTAFGLSGLLFTDLFSGSIDASNAVAVQADGKIVAAGHTRNNGSGTISDFAVVRFLPNAGKPFDFDGDAKTDIGIFRPASGEWWINRSSNSSGYALQFGSNTDRITPADYTGDGRTDVAFWRPANGFWFVLRSEDNSFYSFPFGASGDVPAPADFDGDGRADAAVFRPSNATWYISRSTGGATIQQFGQNGDVPVAADYDGDAKADIAVFRPASGQWWIQRSSGGTVAFQFGSSSDKPVQGDYTGDGRADVALFRPASGEWFVLRSENQSFYSFPFGAGGDVPVPGDYDGDGKADAAVFRPSNSTWYAQRATAGTLIQSFGQSGDRPVPNAFVP